jgi:hypothetical protein
MSAPLPRIVIDNDTPQAVVRAAGMTLLTLERNPFTLHHNLRRRSSFCIRLG